MKNNGYSGMPDVSAAGMNLGDAPDVLAALGGTGGADLLAEVTGRGPSPRGTVRLSSEQTSVSSLPGSKASFREIGREVLQKRTGDVQPATTPASRQQFNTRSPFATQFAAAEEGDEGEGEDEGAEAGAESSESGTADREQELPEYYRLLNNDNQVIKDKMNSFEQQQRELMEEVRRRPAQQQQPVQKEPEYELDPELEPFKQYIDHRMSQVQQHSEQRMRSIQAKSAHDRVVATYQRLSTELPGFSESVPFEKLMAPIKQGLAQNPDWVEAQNWEGAMRAAYSAQQSDSLSKENAELKKKLASYESKKEQRREKQKDQLHLVAPVSGGAPRATGLNSVEQRLFSAPPMDRRKRGMRAFANELKSARRSAGL